MFRNLASTFNIFSFFLPILFFEIFSYAQELPSRCKKDIIKAADVDCTGQLRLEQLEMILSNIGASASISRNEIKTIFSEAGESGTNTIQADQMMKLL